MVKWLAVISVALATAAWGTVAALAPDARRRPTLTVEEAAEVVGISRGAAYQAARTGEIPTLRIGRRILVPTARLLDLLGIGADADDPRPAA